MRRERNVRLPNDQLTVLGLISIVEIVPEDPGDEIVEGEAPLVDLDFLLRQSRYRQTCHNNHFSTQLYTRRSSEAPMS